jgi:hypothetical protein
MRDDNFVKDGKIQCGYPHRGKSIREFETGATRDTNEGKLDYEGFISPLALRRYAEYMHKHRVQADGNLRDSDNWQKGIPVEVYRKSLTRHFMDTWYILRGWADYTDAGEDIEELLCAMLFNTMGLLHETIKGRKSVQRTRVSQKGDTNGKD